MWGDNNYGQLGDGINEDKRIPTKITGDNSTNQDMLEKKLI